MQRMIYTIVCNYLKLLRNSSCLSLSLKMIKYARLYPRLVVRSVLTGFRIEAGLWRRLDRDIGLQFYRMIDTNVKHDLHECNDIREGIQVVIKIGNIIGDVCYLRIELLEFVLVHFHHCVQRCCDRLEIHVRSRLKS